jgi:hypothetical protein
MRRSRRVCMPPGCRSLEVCSPLTEQCSPLTEQVRVRPRLELRRAANGIGTRSTASWACRGSAAFETKRPAAGFSNSLTHSAQSMSPRRLVRDPQPMVRQVHPVLGREVVEDQQHHLPVLRQALYRLGTLARWVAISRSKVCSASAARSARQPKSQHTMPCWLWSGALRDD